MNQRRIVITGASRGLGRAVALYFARSEQADCLLLGRDGAGLEATALALKEAGGRATTGCADVTDRAALAEQAARVERVDVVIANAGIGGQSPLAKDDSDRLFDQIVATDLTGVWNTVRAFSPRMGRGGRIVLVSSVLGRFGVPGYGAYCAAKHGVIGLCKALALELAPRGIFVNAVAPGWVDTDMASSGIAQIAAAGKISPAQARAQAEAVVPVGRFFEADEIARGIAWLASPDNTMQVGQCLNLDGGVLQY